MGWRRLALPTARKFYGDAWSSSADIVRFNFPFVDLTPPKTWQMRAILLSLHNSIQAGRRVYLHCRGGIGRTGTVLACYFKLKGMSSKEAINLIENLRWSQDVSSKLIPSPESKSQIDFVNSFRG